MTKSAIVHLLEGQRGAARKYFLQAIRYNPTYVAAINNLGVVALLDKKYKTAVNYFKQALALEETNAPIHVNLAEAWIGLEQIDRAMTEYTRALELDADVLNNSTEGLLAQLSTPEQYARVAYIIAKMYMKRGNIDGALEYLRRAKEENYSEIKARSIPTRTSPLYGMTPAWQKSSSDRHCSSNRDHTCLTIRKRRRRYSTPAKSTSSLRASIHVRATFRSSKAC